MLERKYAKSYRSLKYAKRDLTRLRTSRAIMLYGKELTANARMGTEISLYLQTKHASQLITQWFDATKICERNKIHAM